MRQPPRKSIISYLFPFILIGIIIFAVIYSVSKLGNFSFGANTPTNLEIVNPEIKVLLKNNESWRTVPENVQVKLFAGDAVKTNFQGEAKLKLLKDTFVYIDNNSSFVIDEHKESDAFQKTKITLLNGRILASIDRILNPKSEFIIQYENVQISSRGSTMSIEEGILQVLEGRVKVNRINDDTVIATTEVGVGQQLSFSSKDTGPFAEINGIDSEVYVSSWIERALGKSIEKAKDTEAITVVTEEENKNEDEEKIIEDNKSDETKDDDKIIEELGTKQNNLTIGIEENTEVKIEPFELKGTVSKGATKVIVNNYPLSKFQKGDTQWLYRAKIEWGNLVKGKNTFEVKAIFEDETEIIKSVIINVNIEEKETTEVKNETVTTDEITSGDNEEDTPEEETNEEVNENDTLKLSVISPEEDEKIDYEPVVVRGTAPEGTAKIIIGDYTLRTFKLGDVQWKYSAAKQYGNLTPGKENKYLIKAFDKDDKEIALIQFKFFSTLETSEENE